jgi:protocatechuate 3,4-dioxygenase beta subunit
MTPRIIRRLATGGLVLAGLVATLTAQASAPWVDQWTAAQTHRPAQVLNHARIALLGEPGIRLVIHGLVLAPDGKTPVQDAIVFAYHTDQDGLYRAPGTPEAPWRLQGWARTDSNGRFEFETIRPAPYPNHQVPAHIHTTIESVRFGRQISGALFADDPFVPKVDLAKSIADGPLGGVLAVRIDGRTQHVNYVIRLQPKSNF